MLERRGRTNEFGGGKNSYFFLPLRVPSLGTKRGKGQLGWVVGPLAFSSNTRRKRGREKDEQRSGGSHLSKVLGFRVFVKVGVERVKLGERWGEGGEEDEVVSLASEKEGRGGPQLGSTKLPGKRDCPGNHRSRQPRPRRVRFFRLSFHVRLPCQPSTSFLFFPLRLVQQAPRRTRLSPHPVQAACREHHQLDTMHGRSN